MKTNELKKGDRVQLRNGWYATVQDNAKGNTRVLTVEGFATETGSTYSHDIVMKINVDGTGINTAIVHTDEQLKLLARVESEF